MKDNIVVVFSSHRTEEENNRFIKHIDDTIGAKHITVCYPNFNQYSLPQIYNQAIREHNNNTAIFVFCHNDIIIKTPMWGRLLLSKFNNSDFQIIGVAGTIYLHDNGRWWEDRSKMFGVVEHTDGYTTWVSEYSKEKKGVITPVVVIDGLFMAIDCNNIEHQFDEDFKGYHFYDLPIVFDNVLSGYNAGVTTDIRILHKSIGMTNQQWEENRKQFVEKYKDELPFSINEYL
jgi:hypothetical protein